MTETPICPRPRHAERTRLIHDQGYVCDDCGERLTEDLRLTAKIANESSVTIARLDRLGASGRRTDPAPPLPVNLAAIQDYDDVVNTVTTWARHVGEERGLGLPYGGRRPLAVAADWLASPQWRHVEWLRHRPEAEEAFDELAYACGLLERSVGRPPDRVLVGRCGCGEYLYALARADQVACRGCGTTYNVEATRQLMRDELDDMLFTAAEIATLAAYLGLADRRDSARKLINKWSERGLVVIHAYQGEAAYRFGEVVDRLVASRVAS